MCAGTGIPKSQDALKNVFRSLTQVEAKSLRVLVSLLQLNYSEAFRQVTILLSLFHHL